MFNRGGNMKVNVMMPVCIFLGLSVMLLASCSPTGTAAFKPGKWSMTMTTVIQGDSPEAKEARDAAKQMQNMPPAARAMMQKMSGSMGASMGTDAQGNMMTTITQCLTEENPVSQGKIPKTCQQTHSTRGKTVTYRMVCKDRNSETETNGKMTYSGDTMKGESRTHQVMQGKAMDTLVKMEGKYLGPCKK